MRVMTLGTAGGLHLSVKAQSNAMCWVPQENDALSLRLCSKG